MVKQFLYFRQLLAGWARRIVWSSSFYISGSCWQVGLGGWFGQAVSIFQADVGGAVYGVVGQAVSIFQAAVGRLG